MEKQALTCFGIFFKYFTVDCKQIVLDLFIA